MTNEQREQIIVIASKMFVREGIKSVRMDDIAHQGGISKRTLYETFGDKEELIYLAMERYFDEMAATHQQASLDSPNVMIGILLAIKSVIDESEHSWRVINTLHKFHRATLLRLNNRRADIRRQNFKMALEEGVAEGLLNPTANLDLAITMLHSIASSVISPDNIDPLPEGLTPQQALYEMTIYFLRGIATAKGVESIEHYLKDDK